VPGYNRRTSTRTNCFPKFAIEGALGSESLRGEMRWSGFSQDRLLQNTKAGCRQRGIPTKNENHLAEET
jgi:hypothetical protein